MANSCWFQQGRFTELTVAYQSGYKETGHDREGLAWSDIIRGCCPISRRLTDQCGNGQTKPQASLPDADEFDYGPTRE